MDWYSPSTPRASPRQERPQYHRSSDLPPSHTHPLSHPAVLLPLETPTDGALNGAGPKYKQFRRSIHPGRGLQGPRYAIQPPTMYSKVNPVDSHSCATTAASRAHQEKPSPNHPQREHSHPAPPTSPVTQNLPKHGQSHISCLVPGSPRAVSPLMAEKPERPCPQASVPV